MESRRVIIREGWKIIRKKLKGNNFFINFRGGRFKAIGKITSTRYLVM